VISGSSLGRATKCLWWVGNELPQETSPAASLGTEVHNLLDELIRERAVDRRYDAICSKYSEEAAAHAMPDAARKEVQNLSIMGARSEVAYAFNPFSRSARELPQKHHRDYSDVGVNEIPITIDVSWFSADTLYIRDWKTGQEDYTVNAKDSWQLKLAAVCVLLTMNYPPEWVQLEHAFVGPNKFVRQLAFCNGQELIDQCVTECGRILEQINSPTSEQEVPSPGGHCRYCPSQLDCPAAKETALVAVEHIGKKGLALSLLQPLSRENAHLQRQALDLLSDWSKLKETQLRQYAEQNPIDLGDALWGPTTVNRTSMDGNDPELQQLLKSYGLDVQALAPRKSISRAALSKYLSKTKIDELMRSAYSRELVRTKQTKQFRKKKKR